MATFRTFEAYMTLCHYYGWKPTQEGLKAFVSGTRTQCLKKG